MKGKYILLDGHKSGIMLNIIADGKKKRKEKEKTRYFLGGVVSYFYNVTIGSEDKLLIHSFRLKIVILSYYYFILLLMRIRNIYIYIYVYRLFKYLFLYSRADDDDDDSDVF